MKIAYIDHYQSRQSQHKDPLTIPAALQQIGHEVILISCSPLYDGIGQLNGLPVLSLEAVEKTGWCTFGLQGVVFTSRLDGRFTPSLRKISECGIHLAIKTDSDGTWGYPLHPNYLRARPLWSGPVNWLRHLKWRLPTKYWIGNKLEQVSLADVVIVESPGAAVNATEVLNYWGLDDHVGKIRFIANPVSPAAMLLPLAQQRYNRIVVVGRWEDREIKNTRAMLHVVDRFLRINQVFDFEIIGSGLDGEEVVRYLGAHIDSGRVRIFAELPYLELQERFGQAKIALIPSVLESYCFVAAEALCAGSSIVVTPIESLSYLAKGGHYGSVARGFGQEQIIAALIYEVAAWEHGLRNSDVISSSSRKEFDARFIASQYARLFEV